MQSTSTPESERFFSLAAQPQLTENSRQGSEPKKHSLATAFAALNTQTTQWGSQQSSGGTASGPTVYLYDGSSIIDELDNSGNVLARYAATADIDQPLSVLRGSIGSYYQQDGLGSVTSLSNGSGAVANTYGFDSYGKLNASTGVLINPFQYTGRESDQEIGLYYYRARYYDPSIGRFISEDPIAMVGGLNSYTYGDNRPSSLYDPSGLSGVEPAATQVDAVAAGLQRILDLLPGDPNCMRFLCHGAGSSPTENPIQELTEILQFRAFGVAPIPPTTDSSGNPISITNALSNGYVVGQAITVNTQGAFFSGTWTVDRGKIPGNTPAAQGFILLHELSHLMNSIQPDFNNQAIVDQNDKNIEKNCKKLIKALGRRQ